MTAFLYLGLALIAVLVVMLGLVAWQDEHADAERRRRMEEDWLRREQQFKRRERNR